MIRKFYFILFLAFALTSQLNAQAVNCRKVVIQGRDRRAFANHSPFIIDVDGDGKLDTIISRIYTAKVGRRVSGKAKRTSRETHWISFDIKTGRGRVLNSFFKYQYGTEEADYWGYALVPCQADRDGRVDLLFYSGDDTSEETIILVNRVNKFKVQSRKVKDLD